MARPYSRDRVELFGREPLTRDIERLAEKHGIYCFLYGPPLWQFGKPCEEDGNVDWTEKDLDYVIGNCASKSFSLNAALYRVQRNIPDAELVDNRFCSPPEGVRKTFGRFDCDGHPICYTSFDVETCLHECRAILSDEIYVAVLRPTRSLNLLDLSQCLTPDGVTPFEDPAIWLLALLYDGEDSYDVCRRFSKNIRKRGYDGFIHKSYFQQAAARPHLNVALFGTPIRDGLLRVDAIESVRLSNIVYHWQFGPVVSRAYLEESEEVE